MTENEAIERIKEQACNDRFLSIHCDDSCLYGAEKCEWAVAIKALEEIQAYRAIGTVEELQRQKDYIDTINEVCSGYSAIGTIEEFKALKEKSVAKKSEWKYSRKENIATCKNCSYEHYLGTYHQYATNYCPKCGSKMTET